MEVAGGVPYFRLDFAGNTRPRNLGLVYGR
jgi:hypothetical protein